MRILYIYRHPDMGYSIGRVFKPIEEEMRKHCEVDSVYLPVPNYSLRGLWKNIRTAQKAVKSKKYDVVHITGAEHYLVPFLWGQKVVVTVHDMQSLLLKDRGIRAFLKELLFVKTLRKADILTFISSKTKEECNLMAKTDHVRQLVIGNSVDDSYSYQPKVFNDRKPVLLHIGTKENKNLHRTIKALEGLNVHLRIVGTLSSIDKDCLRHSNVEYSNASDLSDEQMLEEYRECDIVNFPSMYEGFGMPIIEGQAIGRPVVTSNIAPMKDVAGGAAMLVDPTNIIEMREAYISLISSAELRETLVKKGIENVKRFRLEHIVKQYLKLYRNIL